MPSSSPSPMKRPSLTERASSTHSLSSSGKQVTTTHKAHRPHVVSRHSRNVSHGKGLSKLAKVHSTANIASDTQQHGHQRKKSSSSTPPQSPGTSLVRRNTSQAALAKNLSHGNLRKNHSAHALARNLSHPALKKVGLAPAPKRKNKDRRDNVFQIGDHSSEDEEEGEWEDSTTQSPEATRNNSKTSTPARIGTPNGDSVHLKEAEATVHRPHRTSSPPQPSLKTNNRSAPNLWKQSDISPSQTPPEPHLLQQKARGSRAPPAMSTVSAHVTPTPMTRTESTKSFSQITHDEAASMETTPIASRVAQSSSIDGGVSHFLETPASSQRLVDEELESGSPSAFLSNYKPQPSESPEKPRTFHKPRGNQAPSRTQQKLELQRREMIRASASTPTTPPASGIGMDVGSSTSLHSRTGSRSRNRNLAAGGRTLAGEIKAVKQDYEGAVKQLTVVRRFRSPVVESMTRLKESGALPQDIGVSSASGIASKSRPQSRRGISSNNVNGHAKGGVSRSIEDRKLSLTSRSSSRGGGRVHFQRQTSHDDIEVTPSQGSPDGLQDDEHDGLSPEEALLRRIWGSREVYDSGEQSGPR
ncbi:hypothetical protein LTR84_004529 [Exophiala bonariae]|uniref:Uncharacterized protein n=1 Tax=Exophiala bonariae TaxID=1690606 RepID=A0AAV9NN72_9EURO|nr:hypothetical protein LTR84_004529 [Exophiala bonariae]